MHCCLLGLEEGGMGGSVEGVGGDWEEGREWEFGFV